MNKRTREIVHDLLEQKEYNKSISISDLKEKYSVSERTIRYDIDEISSFLIRNKLNPIIIGDSGSIQIIDDKNAVMKIMKDNDFYSFKLNKQERTDMISYLLATTKDVVTLQKLADILCVSRSTVIHDVDSVRKQMKSYDLEVVSYPKGLKLEGHESDLRLLILRLVGSSNVILFDKHYELPTILDNYSISVLEKIIRDAELVHNLFLTDESFESLKRYLRIVVERQQKEKYIEIDYVMKHASMANLADAIMQRLNSYFNLHASLQERYMLSDILYNLNYLKRNDVDDRQMEIQVATKHFIDCVTTELNVNLRDDFQFYQNLSSHLQSTFRDINSSTLNDLTLLKEVVKKNKKVTEAVEKHKMVLERIVQRPFTEEELAYIVIHVCAAVERNKENKPVLSVLIVCNSGIGTSQLLLSRLKKHFRFNVIDVLPSHTLVAYDVTKIDLIISTIPIEEKRCETIVLHPYLTDEDCLKLSNKIDSIKISKNTSDTNLDFLKVQNIIANAIDYSPLDKDAIYKNIVSDLLELYEPVQYKMKRKLSLSDLLRHHIAIDVEVQNWEESIVKSAMPLKEEGYFSDIYLEQMILNVKKNGPYIVLSPGFALPHEAPTFGTKKLGMYLIRLKKPVEYHSELNDPVDFVCCLSTIDKESHLKAMFNFMNLLSKQSFLEDLRKAKSSEEMYQMICEYEEML